MHLRRSAELGLGAVFCTLALALLPTGAALAAPADPTVLGPLTAPPVPASAAVPAPAASSTSAPSGDSATPATRASSRAGTTPAPLWELGVGLAGLSLPDYRGAAHRRAYLLPLPYVIYRGAFLRADREGARAVLLDSSFLDVDVSVAATPPSRSEPDGPRAGMPDLAPTFEIGPNVNITLWRNGARNAKVDLRLPVRTAIALQGGLHSVGNTFDPKINLDLNHLGDGWRMGFQLGALNGSRRYHERIYSVTPDLATASRPAYEARGGRAGWQALAAMSHRFDRLWVGGFVRHDTLGNAVFANSPLVQRRHTWTAGLGMAWVFARSTELVDVADR
jgi:outer membrane scaffolding protein for murein synthesis (MipA/OmpV family)